MAHAFWFVLMILVTPMVSFAQKRGVVVGRVLIEPRYQISCITESCPRRDPKPIQSAWVFAEHHVSGRRYSTLSGKNGTYRLRVPAGGYTLSVPEIGALRRVVVRNGQARAVNLKALTQ